MNITPYDNWSICRAGGLAARPDILFSIGSEQCAGSTIRIGAGSDSHPPEERALGITRGILELLRAGKIEGKARPHVMLRTRFEPVLRDLALLKELGAAVEIPISTLKPSLAAGLEPGSPAPRSRLALLRRLAKTGIDVGVAIDPVLPGMTDRLSTLENITTAVAAAGAGWIVARGLRLPGPERGRFYGFLARERPGLVRRYRARFGGSGEPPESWEERMLDMVRVLRTSAGLGTGPDLFGPDSFGPDSFGPDSFGPAWSGPAGFAGREVQSGGQKLRVRSGVAD